MKFERPDPTKLRNGTLVTGVTLLVISAAQVQIDVTKPISFLGMPLIIEDQYFLTYALMCVSGYYLFRYCFYSMTHLSTWAIRKTIFSAIDNVSSKNIQSIDLASESVVEDWYEAVHHSGIKCDDVSSKYIPPTNDLTGHWKLQLANPRKYSFVTFLRDLDFSAPAIINVAALSFAIRNIVV